MQKILKLKQGTQKAMFFLFFLLCSTVMMAQNKVSGTVLDATGEPLIGVSVLEAGTTNGVVTDYNGMEKGSGIPDCGATVAVLQDLS